MDRVILHCDCNCFYASVAIASKPELAKVPMAVAGDPKARHGIILAKNQLAKEYGIATAEPIWQARQKCPNLVLVPPDYPSYQKYSLAVNAIYHEYTDLAEPFGLDETFLDVTGTLHLFGVDGKGLADLLRARVRGELGITISVGVSFTKTFAKLGSDYKKPDATTCFGREDLVKTVYPMPVETLLFVGKRTKQLLQMLGIETIGQLAAADPMLLQQRLGKAGAQLSRMARGEDTDPVLPADYQEAAKSVGNGMTFAHDLHQPQELDMAAALLAESVAGRMRKEQVNCCTVQVAWKTSDFECHSRQVACSEPTHLAGEIARLASGLLRAQVNFKKPIRSITVTALHLEPVGARQQLSLFTDDTETAEKEKEQKLEDALYEIRERYGVGSIRRASLAGSVLEGEESEK